MKPTYFYKLIVVSIASVFISSLAYGQGALDKTTFGKSQNDSRDLVNSLIPGPQRLKHEKKEEVDPKKLQSKAIKDPTFGGSLVEMGLGSTGDPDVHLQKPHNAPDQDSNAPKPAEAVSEKDSKVSKQANTSGEKDSKASKSTEAADGQNKDQKATSTRSDEKPSDKEKASPSKPDGDR
ncbi:MAG TPA: hypothetical protein VNW72_07325 [Chthoniobacterales bacterium]|jgi:hypothetical protein|nr:hypothetical protein [Chthoniobacterales bacterium]